MRSDKPILVVEDDKIDAMTVKRALKDIHVSNDVIVQKNGEEALAYLENLENERPCIILLDLNMPKMNGVEFLKKMKENKDIKLIPVIVLTTSLEERDRVKTFDLGIAGYMIKPVDYLQFVDVMKAINLYWTISELP